MKAGALPGQEEGNRCVFSYVKMRKSCVYQMMAAEKYLVGKASKLINNNEN
jgi:hypothetical protein